MTVDELDRAIATKRMLREGLVKELESAKADFLAVADRECAAWIETYVKKTVQEEHEQTQKLGQDGIHALKEELKKLLESIPTRVNELVGADEVWQHRTLESVKSNSYRLYNTFKLPDIVNKPIRAVLSFAGDLLSSHGYLTKNGGWKREGQQMKFQFGIEMPQPLVAAVHPYAERVERLISLDAEIESLVVSRKQTAAKDMWDSA